MVGLAWDRDLVDAGLGTSKSFLELSAAEGGLEGTEPGWEETVGVVFVATRLFGLSGTELVWVGALGFGGGIAFGRGAGTIVILRGPACILGASPDRGVIPGWTRVTPLPRGGG